MIKAQIIESKSGKTVDIGHGINGSPVLITESYARLYGSFKTGTYSNETATVVSPITNGSLQIVDLMISSGKSVAGFATLNFYDGTNTVVILRAEADYGIQLAMPFQGHWQGWEDAYVQVIVSAAFDVTVAIGYVKIPPERTLAYAAWDALR